MIPDDLYHDVAAVIEVLIRAGVGQDVEPATLLSHCGDDPERVNDAIDYLQSVGWLEAETALGTAPFDVLAVSLTRQGKREAPQAMARRSEQSTERPQPSRETQTASEVVVFESHAHVDRDLAHAVAELLRGAFDLTRNKIRCTSAPGYSLPGGAKTADHLRHEINSATSFIGLLSPASIRSSYVLFELGARWGQGKQLIPLLAPGFSTNHLEEPLKSLNALSLEREDQIHNLIETVGNVLQRQPLATHRYFQELQTLRDVVQGYPSVVQNLKSSASTTHPEGKPKLSPEVMAALRLYRDRPAIVITADVVASRLNRDSLEAQYFLDRLEEVGFVDEVEISSSDETQYVLTKRGRAALAEEAASLGKP